MKTKFYLSFVSLIALLVVTGSASARPLNAPLGTGFTYQGKLTDAGAPANGTYDFEFNLYDALSGGSPVGSTVTQGDVSVTNGLFTVQLDFGDVFDGTALYLDIGVRPGASVGAYTALAPRQPLTATPYAIYASKAPWNGLTGVPAGFADGVDNGSAYQNVKVVAKSGGDFTSIQAALDSITTAGQNNNFLVWVAPGVYFERVTMKQYVDIEGAGELTTKITFVGSPTNTTGTLLGADNAELRFLTVENTGSNTDAIAIYNGSAAPRLTHITASAAGGTVNYGVFNSSSSPMMSNVTASASGGYQASGVYNYSSSSPTMTNVTASALGGTDYNFGVFNYTSSPKTMTDVTASASGGLRNYGVYNIGSSPPMTRVTASASGVATENDGVYDLGSSPTMTDVIASASGGTTNNYGVYNRVSSPTMTNVTANGTGGTNSYGVYNFNSSSTINNSIISGSNYAIYNLNDLGTTYTVQVKNSQISGSTSSIRNDAGFTTRIGASQLSGGAVDVSGGGTLTCAGVYDEAYAFSASTCP